MQPGAVGLVQPSLGGTAFRLSARQAFCGAQPAFRALRRPAGILGCVCFFFFWHSRLWAGACDRAAGAAWRSRAAPPPTAGTGHLSALLHPALKMTISFRESSLDAPPASQATTPPPHPLALPHIPCPSPPSPLCLAFSPCAPHRFVNSIKTIDGGTHIDGLKAALTRTGGRGGAGRGGAGRGGAGRGALPVAPWDGFEFVAPCAGGAESRGLRVGGWAAQQGALA